jgi:hypothetical protein
VQDVMVAETEMGNLILAHAADETERVVAGIVADVRAFLRSPKPALQAAVRRFDPQVVQEPMRAYVRVPFAAKDVVLAVKPEILSEKIDGDGLWQAVVEVKSPADLQVNSLGGMVYPLSGEWEAPVAGSVGLRMVG